MGCCIRLKGTKILSEKPGYSYWWEPGHPAWLTRVECWKTPHFSSFFHIRTSEYPLGGHNFFKHESAVVWGNFWPVSLQPMLGVISSCFGRHWFSPWIRAWSARQVSCAGSITWRFPRRRLWACWPTWQMPCEVYCHDLGLIVTRCYKDIWCKRRGFSYLEHEFLS